MTVVGFAKSADLMSIITSAPLTDAIAAAVARLIDDSQGVTRQPSHSELREQIQRVGLDHVDPGNGPKPVGKAKRVRAVLHWAIENDVERGERLVAVLIASVRGVGGFREGSQNFVGKEPIDDLAEAMRTEGWQLASTGELVPLVLDSLTGAQMTDALKAYVRRARKGALDAALLAGTGKDLVEAVAAHVLVERFGTYPQTANFPTLVGQAFIAVGLDPLQKPNPTPVEQVDRALYELACAVNRLRNKQGTGHGRPFVPSVTQTQARSAVQSMGLVAARLLEAL